MTARGVAVVLAAVVGAVLAAGGCRDEADPSSATTAAPAPTTPSTVLAGGESVPVSTLIDALSGLCLAASQATTDSNQARTTFYDRAHDALHTLARALEGVDRPAAAGLLVAKERVEAELTAAAAEPGGKLAGDLNDLISATRRGLGGLSIDAPACEEAHQ